MKWYEDPIYIKMCEKAEEIQKKWDGRCRRKFIYDLDNKQLFNYTGVLSEKSRKGLIWLPTQSQLQEMITKEKEYAWHLLDLFNKWVRDKSPKTKYFKENFSNFSMEQLWLAFVMKELYNKIWDGKEWVKE